MKTITKLILGIVIIAVAVFSIATAASISLAPLSAQYAMTLDDDGAGTVRFSIIGGAVQISIPAPASAALILTTPSGSSYRNNDGPVGIVDFQFMPPTSDSSALGPQHALWLLTLPVSQAGEYTLAMTDTSRSGQVLPVTVSHPDSTLRTGASVGLGQGAHRVGKPVVVAAFVYDGTTPVSNARISAAMAMIDGTPVARTVLRDDGIAPDNAAGDGTYVGLLTPSAEGIATVRLDIHGRTADEQLYQATHGTLLTIGGTEEIQLTGEFLDEGIDLDGDGLIDALRFHFGYGGQAADVPYGLQVILEASDGQRVHGYGELISGDLVASIPASAMTALGVDGPYQVAAVILDREGRLLERLDNLGQTHTYTRSDWNRKTLQFGSVEERAVDNNDGLIDELQIIVAVESLISGNFGMSLDLRDIDGSMLATTAISSIDLQTGTNQLHFTFPGAAIGRSGQDGPYVIGNALLYPNFHSGATAFADTLASTRPYQCQEFVECNSGDPLALLKDLDTAIGQADLAWSIRLPLQLKLSLIRATIEREHFKIATLKLNSLIATIRLTPRIVMPTATAEHLLALAAKLHQTLKE